MTLREMVRRALGWVRWWWTRWYGDRLPAADAQEQEAIRREQLACAGRQTPGLALANFGLCALAAVVVYAPAVARVLTVELVVLAVLVTLRLWLAWTVTRRVEVASPAEVADLSRKVAVLSGLTGAVWGALGVLMLLWGSADDRAFVDCLLVGGAAIAVAAGAVAVSAAARAFLFLSLLPVSVGNALAAPGRAGAGLALLLAGMLAVLLWALCGGQAVVCHALLGRLRNEKLAGKLAVAVASAEAAAVGRANALAAVSHEVRTPLNGVIGMTELLLRTELTPVQREYVEGARASGNAVLAVVNDVLDLARLEAGGMPLETIGFVPRDLLAGIAAPFRAEAAASGVVLEIAVAPEVPATLVGDPHRLRQVLTNLLSNAVKFTPAGRIGVSLRVVGEGPEGLEMVLEVSDTGPGIPSGQQAQIFEPYAQAENSTARRYGGSGLGLAIVRQLCALMGGTVTVRSQAGQGATFCVTFHCARAAAMPASAVVAPVPPVRGPAVPGKVLLVEDNEINILVAEGMLRRLGCQVETVRDGARALARLGAETFDLVLMDCRMPGMDGPATTAAWRACEPAGRRVPVVALTASDGEGERERCRAAGMDDFLLKPLRMAELQAVLARWGLGVSPGVD